MPRPTVAEARPDLAGNDAGERRRRRWDSGPRRDRATGLTGRPGGVARRAEHKGLGPVTIWSPEGRRRRDRRRGHSGTEGNEGEEEGGLDRAEEARGEGVRGAR